jgi:ABC-type polysaccharide/polyol phosphate transport system ATPase subunit
MALVALRDVHVDFPIYGSQHNLRKVLLERAAGGLISREDRRPDRVVVKALNGLSLRLEDGDRIGLVGHNGAGKSTLLKVIAGIYAPVSGTVRTEGRITTLFHAMPGLDMEDTGYENILTAGLLLGMTRQEIEAKVPEIEQVSELGEYLALPVRTYSSGMVTRLSFALATSVEPGILLMDEGIATGDARFAERAAKRLKEFIGRSRIVVLASHSTEIIRSTCNKAALMQSGRILRVGKVEDILAAYDALVHGRPPEPTAEPADAQAAYGG